MTEEQILYVAKNIEVGLEKYVIRGTGNGYIFTRNGVEMTLDEIWDSLTDEERTKRIKEANGAICGMYDLGVDMFLNEGIRRYISEK